MHLAEPIKVFLAMRRVKREGKRILLKFKSRPHGVFGVWHLLKSHYEKWVQKSPEALRHPGFLGWHPLRMHNMVAEKGLEPHDLRVMSPTSYQLLHSAILGNHLLITVLLYAITGRLSTLFLKKSKIIRY